MFQNYFMNILELFSPSLLGEGDLNYGIPASDGNSATDPVLVDGIFCIRLNLRREFRLRPKLTLMLNLSVCL